MFAGTINRQVVISCHPVIVAGQKGVAAGFGSLDDARRFLTGRGFRSGCIYRHNGSDWDKVEEDQLASGPSPDGWTHLGRS
jgi:hypothetical protein